MTRELIVRTSALYLPLLTVSLALLLRAPRRRLGAAVMLATLWVAVALLATQELNLRLHWWTFASSGPALRSMPLELYLGWCCLWGAVPPMLFPRVPLRWTMLGAALFDLATMPLCSPVVRLSPRSLAGEAVVLGIVLLPALLVARWTLDNRRLAWRATMQVAISGGVFLWFAPELIFAVRGGSWGRLPSGTKLGLLAQLVCVLAFPGVSAVHEFCVRGCGTPIPQDPPQKLVVSGIYRYVANPMQISCTLVMLFWGAALRSGWVSAIGVLSVIYSAGIARWDERLDLSKRFGDRWVKYRSSVHDWRWRWRPYVEPGKQATLYIADSCQMCSEVAVWFGARNIAGMRITAAESFPGPALQRMRYVSADGLSSDDGIAAFARGLEHVNLPWALLGAAMRLPLVVHTLQVIADASGLGPRNLNSCDARHPAASTIRKSFTES